MRRSLDKVGIFLSGTCMVHCILAPLVIACAPFLGEIFENPIVHGFLLVLVAPIAFFTLLRSDLKSVQLCGILGLMLLGFGFFHEASLAGAHPIAEIADFHLHNETSHFMSICGGVLLCLAHFINLRGKLYAHC